MTCVEQVAELVEFLCLSNASSQMTGASYLIDGGYVAQWIVQFSDTCSIERTEDTDVSSNWNLGTSFMRHSYWACISRCIFRQWKFVILTTAHYGLQVLKCDINLLSSSFGLRTWTFVLHSNNVEIISRTPVNQPDISIDTDSTRWMYIQNL